MSLFSVRIYLYLYVRKCELKYVPNCVRTMSFGNRMLFSLYVAC